MIPLAAVMLWDNMPRYRAIRQLREAGIEQTNASVHQAVKEGNLKVLELLDVARVPMDELDEQGRTPLVAAVLGRKPEITGFLTSLPHVNCDRAGNDGLAPLAHAISSGNLNAVKQLLLRIQNPNIDIETDGGKVRALLKATQDQDGTLLRLLLTHPKIDLNVRDASGKTPLHLAVEQGNDLVARALFAGKRQPDPDTVSKDGETPLGFSVRNGRSRLAKLLLDQGATFSREELPQFLLSAIHNRDGDSIEALLSRGGDPNINHPDQPNTLLNYAIDESANGCVLAFINSGANLNGTLRRAIQCGNSGAVELLVTYFHDQNQAWPHKDGLLELAIYSGRADIAEMILEHGADPNEYASCGQRVLPLAIAARHESVVQRLLELGADPNLRLDHPVTHTFLGFFDGDAKSKYYLKRDREITPLMLACLTEQQSAVESLVDHGAHRNAYTARYKRYAVAFASERHNVPIMQIMLGREPNDESRKVVVSLKKQRAVMYQNGETVRSSRVSTGKRGHRTPTGRYVITNKYRHHNSSLYGSAMPYFMRLSCGDFGLHYSASVPSYPASHGCIRMPWNSAKSFYASLQVGDIVEIVN